MNATPFLNFGISRIRLIIVFISGLAMLAATANLRAAHTQASVLAAHSTVTPGQSTQLALHLRSEPGWHTYAKDPGESGLPTSIEWKNTLNAAVGEWLWPPSHKFSQAGLTVNVFEGDTIILIPVAVKADAKSGETVQLAGTVSWLECDDKKCIPGETAFSLTLPIAGKAIEAAANAALFERAQPPKNIRDVKDSKDLNAPDKVPNRAVPSPSLAATAAAADLVWEVWTPEHQQALLDAGRLVYVDFTAAWCVTCLANKHVYSDAAVIAAFQQNNIALLRADWTKKNRDIAAELARYHRAAIPFNIFLRKDRAPVALSEVLTSGIVLDGLKRALSTETPSNAHNARPPAAPTETAFPVRLLFGFLGGFLLNLMPCVFPVLGLKLMHFAGQAGNARNKIAAHSLVFTAGVVLSFWALAAVLLVLRAGGQTLGWGFQLQEPRFVFVLAVLLLSFGLNMAGVFEVGQRAIGTGENLCARPGFPGAFFSGVLATVAATPCAAPFLGVALGTALTLPAMQALAMFTAIALGLSAPFLLFAAVPGLLRVLPRPGAWMETLKQGLSFLLFASVAYLVWVLAAQIGAGYALLQILLGLVAVAAACWIYGRWTPSHRSVRSRRIGFAAALALFAAVCVWGISTL
jgi:thiol:disulfide interchange protein DsbD